MMITVKMATVNTTTNTVNISLLDPINVAHNHNNHLSCYSEIELVYTSSTKTHFLAIGTFYGIGSFLAVTFNALFLTTVKRKKTLHKLSNYLLVCLSVFDLVSGLTILPAAAVILYGRGFFTRFCTLERHTHSFGYALASMSCTTIFTITIEQYIAITNPFFHQNKVSFKRLLVPMVIFWTLLAVASVVSWPDGALWVYFQVTAGLLILVTYVTVVFCYTRMFVIARKTRRKIRESCIIAPQHRYDDQRARTNETHVKPTSLNKQSSVSTIGSSNNTTNYKHITSSRSNNNDFNNNNNNNKTNWKATITSFSIILAFTVAYLPLSIYSLKRFVCHVSALEHTVTYEWVQLIALYNSVVSPLVYYWRLRGVRHELLKIFRSKKGVVGFVQ